MSDIVEKLRSVSLFLRGHAPLKGAWFGESLNGVRGLYWWRKELPLDEAAEAILALRKEVEAAYRTGYSDGAEDQQRDGFTHKDAVNEGWHNFTSAALATEAE